MPNAKAAIKALVPPILLELYRQKSTMEAASYGYFGDFNSWDDVTRLATGYESDNILEKVKTSLLKVKNGEAVFERDSVLFEQVQYSFPLLAGILWVAANCNGQLNVIDFGGSLGSHFFQNRQFFQGLSSVRWSVVEQENYVQCGQQFFQDDQLKFYFSINDCLNDTQPKAVILSGVLSYLPEPYDFLRTLLEYDFEYLLVDRTPLIDSKVDRLTLQKVPPVIYNATYPAWFFSESRFNSALLQKYEVLSEFDALAGCIHLHEPDADAQDRGFLLKHR